MSETWNKEIADSTANINYGQTCLDRECFFLEKILIELRSRFEETKSLRLASRSRSRSSRSRAALQKYYNSPQVNDICKRSVYSAVESHVVHARGTLNQKPLSFFENRLWNWKIDHRRRSARCRHRRKIASDEMLPDENLYTRQKFSRSFPLWSFIFVANKKRWTNDGDSQHIRSQRRPTSDCHRPPLSRGLIDGRIGRVLYIAPWTFPFTGLSMNISRW